VDTGIADTGASGFYFRPDAPVENVNTKAPPIYVGTATGQPQRSAATADFPALPQLPAEFPRSGHVMPTFKHTLIGIGPICDADCQVLFSKTDVTVFSPDGSPILQGWRDEAGAKLWRFALRPDKDDLPPRRADTQASSLAAYSAYDLPSVVALVRYLHAAAGFPVKKTWLAAIKAGNFATWPGLTYSNAAKYFPESDETVKGHLTQSRKGTRSTKPKSPESKPPKPIATEAPESPLPSKRSNEVHIVELPLSKLYTDDCGRFPIRSRSGNQYIMVAYHCDSNAILFTAFKTRNDRHRIPAYNSIMERLQARGHKVDVQILDNEASADYKSEITERWQAQYQLVPPDVHRRNAAERAIRTLKAHFVAILSGVDPSFPQFLWDQLLEQTEITLNLLRQATLNPRMSAWEYFNGPFDFNATPLGPMGCRVLIHNKPSTRKTWDQRGRDGFSLGPALQHYRCYTVADKKTKATIVSDTVEFRHSYLTQPTLTPEDRMVHAMNMLSCAIKDAPATKLEAQLDAIQQLRELLTGWQQQSPSTAAEPSKCDQSPPEERPFPRVDRPLQTKTSPSVTKTQVTETPAPVTRPSAIKPRSATKPAPTAPAPRVQAESYVPLVSFHGIPTPKGGAPAPRVPQSEPIAQRTRAQQGAAEPIARRTRSQSKEANFIAPRQAASRRFSAALLTKWAAAVYDEESGQMLEYRQLIRHPKLRQIWSPSYSDEMGRLCQGVGVGPAGEGKRMEGTDTFRVIRHDDIPKDRLKEVCYTSVQCTVRPQKADPNRTRITIAGNRICYPGDVGTPTASLDLVKLMLNSVLSRRGAKFACFDVSNFYLGTPLDRPEYVKIKLTDIPQEFIDEYDLTNYAHNGWVYFSIHKGVYGLPQSGKLAHDQLRVRLEKEGYYETATTPGLWRHKWRPIQFCLIVDDFGVEYVGREHAEHLASILKNYHDITEDWEGKKFAGIDLKWDYALRTCRLTMEKYIEELLAKYNHPRPRKLQRSPYKCMPIQYGNKTQFAAEEDTSPSLDGAGILRVQGIVGSLLYYARAVNNKLLVALNAIGSEQATATEATNAAIDQLLDYVATYPNDGITYRASDMVLAAHSDAGYLNASKARSRAGAFIFLSEDEAVPRLNGPVMAIAQIIKHVMTSAAEAEIAALFITSKELVPLRQTLEEMGWPQPKTPIQTDNSTAVGVTNNTIVPKRTKSMDMRFHWLRCREAQGQFRFYWAKGPDNEGDYHTKAHPDIYHETKRQSPWHS